MDRILIGHLVTSMVAGSQFNFYKCSDLKGTVYWKSFNLHEEIQN